MRNFTVALITIAFTMVQIMVVAEISPPSDQVWKVFVALLILNGIAGLGFIRFLRKTEIFTAKVEDHNMDYTLEIANETLPYLRRGLTEETASKTAEIILKISDVSAVAITDRERVLAYVGAGCERHQAGRLILTRSTKQVLATGELSILENKKNINCPVKDCDCPLESAVVAPLWIKGEVAGCIKLYQTKHGKIPPEVVKLAVGIGQLLGLQMELAELDRQAQLVTKAELAALHAQINPHFLFNTLNTIIMFSRTNPETARQLLIRLATFFRQSLKKHGYYNTLREEIEYINTYLVLEKARFREKLRIQRDIDQELLEYKIPVLTIQPLVENAVKHGITPKMDQGTVTISVKKHEGELLITVKDDGVGISKEDLKHVLISGFGKGNGVGISNVHERLKSLYGEDHGVKIVSEVNKGTSVSVRIPLMIDASERGDNVNEA